MKEQTTRNTGKREKKNWKMVRRKRRKRNKQRKRKRKNGRGRDFEVLEEKRNKVQKGSPL